MRTILFSTLLILLLAAVPSHSRAANPVNDVFGITVGGLFSLSDCAAKTAPLPCADMAYMSREANEQEFTPVRIAVRVLPTSVDPSSVRIRIVDGNVNSLRYSVQGAGDELYRDLVQRYGGKDVFVAEINRQNAHVQWSLPEVLVTVDATNTTRKNWAVVEISAQPELITTQDPESIISTLDNLSLGGTDRE